MGWKPYVRCPCCGKLATGYALGHAGTHTLEVRQCVKALGYRYGFEWDNKPLPAELAGGLVRGLAKALVQVLALVTPPVELLRMAEQDIAAALATVRRMIDLTPRGAATSLPPVVSAELPPVVRRELPPVRSRELSPVGIRGEIRVRPRTSIEEAA